MRNVAKKARAANNASKTLAALKNTKKKAALNAIARALRDNAGRILKANAIDVKEAEKDVAKGRMSPALLKRLMLNEAKIEGMASGVESVAKLPDPVGNVLSKRELDRGLILEQVTCPIGVIGAVFESRPDAVPQISSLCLKSGNAVLLKGGSEASRSNKVLVDIISKAANEIASVPSGWIHLIETRAEVREVLGLDEYIDLLVPRGSNAFVRYIQENTQIPVLGHADGICHVYVDKLADMDTAVSIAFDSKTQYTAVCNAAETLLVHAKKAGKFLPLIVTKLKDAGVEVRGCAKTRKIVSGLKMAKSVDWFTEYLELIISIKVVDSMAQAVEHINKYGSGHTDTIVTKSKTRANAFMDAVDSSCVFHNASTRFSDGYRFGLGAELGISTNKTHARGPVGVEGLVLYKFRLYGEGQVVADYSDSGGKKFTHKKLLV
jgi:glutamate-5-semialdehyde dehydrogenase